MYLARPECISSRSLFYSSTSICILKINQFILWYYTGLGLVPSLSSWDVELLPCFPIKLVAGKCNLWLYFTPQYGLALGDRSRKISTPGCGPPVPPDQYSTQEGHPSWFPLVPSDWGIWASPPETDQDSCPGWLPPVPLDLVSPQEGFSPGPLTPRFKRFPATRILPITFCVFSVWYLA